ncbi:IclR family transcriptional regulator [Salipiger pallidus]|uniref:IclR family transcriptional regulator n=1 Tax=Salipiger pallidus TaxID=1775170 RepID=A0A8J2ZGG6_9RHOB|nr:IclR family transcriptional regulator [Salipiger pallidus]GGG61148.1 IclR family transcriptional regulator [Salipiger pallidus]
MAPKQEKTTGAQSLHRSFGLLRMISSHAARGLSLVEICKRSGIARSTVYRMLRALQNEGLVEQDPDDDRYYLGREAWLMGLAAESRYGMTDVAKATLASLSAEAGDISLFLQRIGTHTVCIARNEGSYPVRTHTAQVGGRYPLGVGGGSLAILAACPDDEIDWILERNADEMARDHPGFPPPFLRELIDETRANGYAVNPGRVYAESWGVGIPFFDPQGTPRGAISLAGVPNRIEPRIPEVVTILKNEQPRLEKRLYGAASGRGID